MGRQAQVWTSQANLTDLGLVSDKMKLEDQFRVRLALRMMRKAHIHGSKSDQERVKMRRKTMVDIFTKVDGGGKKKKKKKNKNGLSHSAPGVDEESTSDEDAMFREKPKPEEGSELLGTAKQRQSFYNEVDPMKIKTIKEIVKDAKHSFAVTKDRLKIQQDAKKYGELRPICGPLIQEIKEIEAKRRADLMMKRKRMGSMENLQQTATWSPAPNFPSSYDTRFKHLHPHKDQLNQHSKASDESSDPNRLFRVIRRHDLLPTKSITPFAMQPMEVETNGDDRTQGSGSIGSIALVEERNLGRPSSAGPIRRMYSSDSASLGRPHSAGIARIDGEGSFEDYDFTEALKVFENGKKSSSFNGTGDAAGTLRRSSSFMPSIIEHDSRISKAMQIKENKQQEKEDKLRKRIQDREETAQVRMLQRQHHERQRCWVVIVEAAQRVKCFVEIIAKYRHDRAWQGHSAASKRAIALIKNWWKRFRIRMILKRNPKVYFVLRRALLMHSNRIRLRKKHRSSDLIVTFLRASTGLSETMVKIYSFRQAVIKMQRWMRQWCDIQIFRTKLLWMAAEKRAKEIAKDEKIQKLKNEKSAMKALSKMTGFSDTLSEINTVRKKLAKVLEYQEDEGVKRRAELYGEIEELVHAQSTAPHGGALPLSPYQVVDKDRRKSMIHNVIPPSIPSAPSSYKMPVFVLSSEHHKKGIKSHDIANNYQSMFLGCADRTKSAKSMDQWFKKVRSSTHTWKTFEMLRRVVNQQRRRHILNITAQYSRRKVCPVEISDLQKFLRDPKDNSFADEISHTIGDISTTKIMATDIAKAPFLLLTQGGLDSIEILLRHHSKSMKFN